MRHFLQDVTLKLATCEGSGTWKMEKVIPMSWLNQILLVFSVAVAISSLVIQAWLGLAPLPMYISISWAVFVTIVSIWLSCYLLRLTLKASSPITVKFINKWIHKRLTGHLGWNSSADDSKDDQTVGPSDSGSPEESSSAQKADVKYNNNVAISRDTNDTPLTRRKRLAVTDMTREINEKCIELWYGNISSDKEFPEEAQDLLKKFLARLTWKISLVDKIKLTNKLANVLLLHLKEYRRYGYRIHLKFYLEDFARMRYSLITAGHYAESRKVLRAAWKKLINICILVLAARRPWSICCTV